MYLTPNVYSRALCRESLEGSVLQVNIAKPRPGAGGRGGGGGGRGPAPPSTKLYVGNLPMSVTEDELRGVFDKYGALKSVEIKQLQRPPAYAWVEFEEVRDAEDALKAENNKPFGPDSVNLRVEFSSR